MLYLSLCCEKNDNKQKEAEIGHFLKKEMLFENLLELVVSKLAFNV